MAVHKSSRRTARRLIEGEATRKPTLAEVRAARRWMAGPHGPGNFKEIRETLGRVIVALRQCEPFIGAGCSAVVARQIVHRERAIEALELSGYEVFVEELHPKLCPPPGVRIAANLELRPEVSRG